MENSIENLIGFILIPSALGTFLGYYIYGWYAHRTARDKSYKELEKQLKIQSIYLEKLAGPLDEETRLRIQEIANSNEEKQPLNSETTT
jgi:hypothetical protein